MAKNLTGKVAWSPADRVALAQRRRALAEDGEDGADVAISDAASADKAEAVVRALEGKGARAAAFKADQGDAAQVDGLVKAVVQRFGRLDTLVNNAGVFVTGSDQRKGTKDESASRQSGHCDGRIEGDRRVDCRASSRGVQGDVAKLADLDRLYDAVKAEKGHIDVVFANAGGGEIAPLGAISEEHFDKTFDINVTGLLFTVQKALPFVVDGGSVILNASTMASTGTPAFSVYSASKATVRSFARTWLLDLRDRGIRVNAVSPGAMWPPGLSALGRSEEEKAKIKAGLIAAILLGRLGDPDETAKAITFLASDDSSYVTGIELFVDGGSAQI